MSFESFKASINALIRRKKLNIKPSFYYDEDKGLYCAIVDGVKIVGNSLSKKITVKWGSAHQAMAKI